MEKDAVLLALLSSDGLVLLKPNQQWFLHGVISYLGLILLTIGLIVIKFSILSLMKQLKLAVYG